MIKTTNKVLAASLAALSMVGIANTPQVQTATSNAITATTQAQKNFFDGVASFIAKWEGGCVNDSSDSGGHTCYGIAANYNPEVDTASLTPDKAREIVKTEYFEAADCDSYSSYAMQLVCGDTAVNFGVGGWEEFKAEVPDTLPEQDKAIAIVQNRKAYREARVNEEPNQEKFLEGWLNRDNDLEKEIQKNATESSK